MHKYGLLLRHSKTTITVHRITMAVNTVVSITVVNWRAGDAPKPRKFIIS